MNDYSICPICLQVSLISNMDEDSGKVYEHCKNPECKYHAVIDSNHSKEPQMEYQVAPTTQ